MDLLYPPVCPFCGKITKQGICGMCRERIPYIEEPRCMKCGKPVRTEEQEYCFDCQRQDYAYEQGKSLWLHSGAVPRAVYRFKFHNKRYYAEIFAKEMAQRYGGWIKRNGVEEIIPVPLHPSKRRRRGFNQAELLAEALGAYIQIPVNKKAVSRIRKTKPQKALNDRERQKNLQGAFGVSAGWKAPESVLIIDDIYTTGSTVHQIARMLKKAGVQKVYFLTISIGQGL